MDGPRTAKARPRSGLKFARHRLNQFDRPALLPAAHNQFNAWPLPARSTVLIELAGSRRGSHAARRRTDTVTKSRWFVSVVMGGELHFCCLRRRTGQRWEATRAPALRGWKRKEGAPSRFALVLCATSHSSLSLHALNPSGVWGTPPKSILSSVLNYAAWAHALSGEAKR